MISRSFVKLWEPRYDRQRNPLDFYLRHIDAARYADQPEEFKEHLLALLHWKDGKAFAYIPGESHARPNTLNPILALTGNSLVDFARSFRDVAEAKENDLHRRTQYASSIPAAKSARFAIPCFSASQSA